jgi:alpha-glucosidase (family GH31 glycosyl hydrolase)
MQSLGESFAGGEWHEVDAPLEWTPTSVREGAELDFGRAALLTELRVLRRARSGAWGSHRRC